MENIFLRIKQRIVSLSPWSVGRSSCFGAFMHFVRICLRMTAAATTTTATRSIDVDFFSSPWRGDSLHDGSCRRHSCAHTLPAQYSCFPLSLTHCATSFSLFLDFCVRLCRNFTISIVRKNSFVFSLYFSVFIFHFYF